MPEPLKLRDTEGTFQMPTSLTGNEVEIIDGDQVFIYRGFAHGLNMNRLDIHGAAFLEKLEKKTKTRKVKVGGFFSRQHEEELVEVLKQVWFVDTSCYGDGKGSDWFVLCGVPERRRNFGYRGALIGKLANKKILVSDALLDAVFGQIDEKLMEVYCTVKNFGGFPKS